MDELKKLDSPLIDLRKCDYCKQITYIRKTGCVNMVCIDYYMTRPVWRRGSPWQCGNDKEKQWVNRTWHKSKIADKAISNAVRNAMEKEAQAWGSEYGSEYWPEEEEAPQIIDLEEEEEEEKEVPTSSRDSAKVIKKLKKKKVGAKGKKGRKGKKGKKRLPAPGDGSATGDGDDEEAPGDMEAPEEEAPAEEPLDEAPMDDGAPMDEEERYTDEQWESWHAAQLASYKTRNKGRKRLLSLWNHMENMKAQGKWFGDAPSEAAKAARKEAEKLGQK